MVREIIKDLENIKGAIINNYNTFSVKYGENKAKQLVIILLILTLLPIIILFNYPGINHMKYYFYFAASILLFIGIYINKVTTKNQYRLLHNILKLLLLAGVFSLIFIDKTLILDKVIRVLD